MIYTRTTLHCVRHCLPLEPFVFSLVGSNYRCTKYIREDHDSLLYMVG